MGKKLDKYKMKNIDKQKIGFCLDLKYKQEFICHQINDLKNFIIDNQIFYKSSDYLLLVDGLEHLSSVFLLFSDVLYSDVDKNDVYCQFHKDFY